jgi:hypothetical protein
MTYPYKYYDRDQERYSKRALINTFAKSKCKCEVIFERPIIAHNHHERGFHNEA